MQNFHNMYRIMFIVCCLSMSTIITVVCSLSLLGRFSIVIIYIIVCAFGIRTSVNQSGTDKTGANFQMNGIKR